MTAPSLTKQAEAILARAKAIDAVRGVEMRREDVRASRCDDAKALRDLCDDLSADADELTVDDWAVNEDYAYEMAVSDRMHAE